MNVCLRLLKISTIEKNLSFNFATLDQLFSRHQTMSEDIFDTDDQGGFGEKEEVIINADSLRSENDELSRKSFDCDINFVKSKEKYSLSRTSISPNITESNLRQKSKCIKKHCDSYPPYWSTGANFSDIVCLGATVLIVSLLISVLIFYVFKDHEEEQ